MPTLAPPNTHEFVNNDPNEVLGEEEPEREDETLDEEICHLLEEGGTLCGTDGLAMPLHALQNPKASPCAGGCGYPRCQRCASLVSSRSEL